ncbi:hypothetical protein TNCV_3065511 [Trichonephila clavipes]|uniref:RNase H type-1 domain-containing protein n=1 Tax=Trichonephila clavipes TaxID=2585209 RepID=A0A8X6V3A1_TRICX|nr:hypothetical protein TNCV_3065511 [Trichonephila clavipes]
MCSFDNYHNRLIESSSGILLFSNARSTLQAILSGNSQLTQDIIALINTVVAAQRTYTLLWIPVHVVIFGNEQNDNLVKDSRNYPQFSNILALTDADATIRHKLTFRPLTEYFIPELICNHVF